jgi:hypothetical protein
VRPPSFQARGISDPPPLAPYLQSAVVGGDADVHRLDQARALLDATAEEALGSKDRRSYALVAR